MARPVTPAVAVDVVIELLDLPESLVARKPSVAEVVRFQTARGDFGNDFGNVEERAFGGGCRYTEGVCGRGGIGRRNGLRRTV